MVTVGSMSVKVGTLVRVSKVARVTFLSTSLSFPHPTYRQHFIRSFNCWKSCDPSCYGAHAWIKQL